MAGDDEVADAVDFYAARQRPQVSKKLGGKATEVYASSKAYTTDKEGEEDYSKMTSQQKLEFLTSESGQVNLQKLRFLEKKTGIQPLERIDHAQIQYKPFIKNFYIDHPHVE